MKPEIIANIGAAITLALLFVGGFGFAIGEWWAKRKYYSVD